MIQELETRDRPKIKDLIKNPSHELTIKGVLTDNSPGHVYVDDLEKPVSGLVKAPECNVLFGSPDNAYFNAGIGEIGFSNTCQPAKSSAFLMTTPCGHAF
jgi:hypothetical protein